MMPPGPPPPPPPPRNLTMVDASSLDSTYETRATGVCKGCGTECDTGYQGGQYCFWCAELIVVSASLPLPSPMRKPEWR
jgi:hypothetical protein